MDLAGIGDANTEDSFQELGPPSANEPRENQDLSTAKREGDVVKFLIATKVAQFKQRLAECRFPLTPRLRPDTLVPCNECNDLLTIQLLDWICANGFSVAEDRDPVD
jgi:hypothetical protein